jgi:hypothetical protein
VFSHVPAGPQGPDGNNEKQPQGCFSVAEATSWLKLQVS